MSEESEFLTKSQKAQQMIDIVDLSMNEIYRGTFDSARADKIAAAAWSAQFILSTLLPDARLRAKQAKNLLKLTKAQADRRYREPSATDSHKKRTEVQIEQLVAADDLVVEAEHTLLSTEHAAEKWECVLSSIKDSHIFFRNLNKS